MKSQNIFRKEVIEYRTNRLGEVILSTKTTHKFLVFFIFSIILLILIFTNEVTYSQTIIFDGTCIGSAQRNEITGTDNNSSEYFLAEFLIPSKYIKIIKNTKKIKIFLPEFSKNNIYIDNINIKKSNYTFIKKDRSNNFSLIFTIKSKIKIDKETYTIREGINLKIAITLDKRTLFKWILGN